MSSYKAIFFLGILKKMDQPGNKSTLNDRTTARLVIFGPWGSLCSGEKVRSKIIA
jgi:hypothetical protein